MFSREKLPVRPKRRSYRANSNWMLQSHGSRQNTFPRVSCRFPFFLFVFCDLISMTGVTHLATFGYHKEENVRKLTPLSPKPNYSFNFSNTPGRRPANLSHACPVALRETQKQRAGRRDGTARSFPRLECVATDCFINNQQCEYSTCRLKFDTNSVPFCGFPVKFRKSPSATDSLSYFEALRKKSREKARKIEKNGSKWMVLKKYNQKYGEKWATFGRREKVCGNDGEIGVFKARARDGQRRRR